MKRGFLSFFLGAAVLMGIPLVGCSEQKPLTVGEGRRETVSYDSGSGECS